jgi:serine/threonine protein kinase/tetratricopeptide (TPR) repeat protein
MASSGKLRPAWLPPSCEFPLYETSSLERSGRLTFDRKEAAAAGAYGEVFPGTYIDDTGTTYRVCSKRDNCLSLIDLVAAKGHQLFDDEELRTFYTRVSNDLLAAWRLLGDPRVVNYLAITTTTRKVASGTVVLPEYFIMEEEGEDRKTWLEHHPPCPENRAAFEGYVQCILEGLAALHSAGITHRDLKPGNVVICRHDASTAKIIDLGLAKTEIAVRAKAVNSMTGGTDWYMPPEFMDPQIASQAVDVWAVGVMCAVWLLGEQVGSHETARAHLNALSNCPDGMPAVWARLREAAAQSGTPQSLLEQVAGAVLVAHAAARPSSIELATAAAVSVPAERKQAAFTRWVGHATHALRDCCAEAMDGNTRRVIIAFLADVNTMEDPRQCIDRLTHVGEVMTNTTMQSSPMTLRVARNFLHSLLYYNIDPVNETKLLRLLGAVYAQTSSTVNSFRALTLFDRVIDINTAALGADHPRTTTTLHAKAYVLVQMGGSKNLTAAVAIFDRVIEINTAALGADHTQTALTLHAKAIALVRMGGSENLTAAVALFDRVIDIKTSALGADHAQTAATLHEKASALVQMGGLMYLTAAVAIFDSVIEINTAALGADHSRTAATLQEKAIALVQMGGSKNLAAAVALLDRVIEIETSAWGADHPQTAIPLHEKARALVQVGGSKNLTAAVAIFDRVIEINTAALGADHPQTAVPLHEKASALVQMGGSKNLTAAVAIFDRVIEINTAALGADHPQTATTLHEKASALVQIGGSLNLTAAVAIFDRVIEINTAALGADHPQTATTLQEKASALVQIGGSLNLTAAVAIFDRVIEIGT